MENNLRIAAALAVVASLLLVAGACLGSEPKIKIPPIEFKMPKVDTLIFANGLHGYLIEDHEIPVVDKKRRPIGLVDVQDLLKAGLV